MKSDLYAIVLRNANDQIWKFVIESESKCKAMQIARNRVLAESDYRIIKSKGEKVQFPDIMT